LPLLRGHAPTVVGVDPLADGTGLVKGNAESLPLADDSFDLAVTLDVLEHVDDRAAMREANRVLRRGGVLLATVPAFPWLWGPRDGLAGHKRRYRRRDVVRLVTENGFDVLELRYYQFLLFPLVVAGRKLGKATTVEEHPSSAVNRLFTAINTFEVRVGDRVRWPWGSTIAVAARKRTG
jgi:SAM-dependent methyltransferase